MGVILFYVILGVWFVFEDVLRSRDRARGAGGSAGDSGTRLQLGITLFVAMVAAAVLAATVGPGSPLRLPGYPWAGLAGLVIACGGLALRLWAVATLGRSFRTTVEVDTDQSVVTSGPYRLIRHPSYTGLLLTATGSGLLSHTWPGLVLLPLLPLLPLLRRIKVEELEMTRVLGQQYRAYSARTKRLIPGLW